MSFDEYWEDRINNSYNKANKKEIEGNSEYLKNAQDYARNLQEKHIQAALSEGKPVPENVLADYPDLKPAPTPEKTDVALEGEGVKKGRALFTEKQLSEFDRLKIDVSGVTEKYKAEALQQIPFKSQHEGKTPEEYNEWVRGQEKDIADRLKESKAKEPAKKIYYTKEYEIEETGQKVKLKMEASKAIEKIDNDIFHHKALLDCLS